MALSWSSSELHSLHLKNSECVQEQDGVGQTEWDRQTKIAHITAKAKPVRASPGGPWADLPLGFLETGLPVLKSQYPTKTNKRRIRGAQGSDSRCRTSQLHFPPMLFFLKNKAQKYTERKCRSSRSRERMGARCHQLQALLSATDLQRKGCCDTAPSGAEQSAVCPQCLCKF